MFLFLWLFSLSCAYASEESVPLLNVVIENNEPTLLVITRKKYYDNKEHWEDDRIHFFDLSEKKVQSFYPNHHIQNLFLELNGKEPLSSIPKLPIMQTFFQEKKLYPEIPNQLEQLFKSIDNIHLDTVYIQRTLYHLKLLLYNIEAYDGASSIKSSYQKFLTLTEKCMSNAYKENLFLNKMCLGCMCMFGGIFFVGPMAVLGAIIKDDKLALSIGESAFGGCLLTMYGSGIYAAFCRWNSYKAYWKTIEDINNDINNDKITH